MEVENVGVSSIEVEKVLGNPRSCQFSPILSSEPQFDLKDLLIYDSNELTGKSNEYLKDLARDNAQLLINQIFKRAVLETEIVNDSVVRIAREKIRRCFCPAARKTDSEKVGANKMGSFCNFKR